MSGYDEELQDSLENLLLVVRHVRLSREINQGLVSKEDGGRGGFRASTEML